jgi:glycosyltransferase involved in cell wall biosynthesis
MHELASPFVLTPRAMVKAIAHRLQLRALLQSNCAFVVTNPRYETWLRRSLHNAKIKQIPVGSNVPVVPLSAMDRQRLRSELGLGDGIVLGDFSPFSVGRRPELLLAAMRYLPATTRAILIGGVHSDLAARARFFNHAAKIGLRHAIVEVPGLQLDELSRMLGIVDIFLHTSDSGASSRSTTLMAALAHSLPVVAFRGVETPDYFTPQAMELSPRRADGGFIDAVTQLARSEARRHDLSRGAGNLYSKRLSWDVICSQFVDLIEEVGIGHRDRSNRRFGFSA